MQVPTCDRFIRSRLGLGDPGAASFVSRRATRGGRDRVTLSGWLTVTRLTDSVAMWLLAGSGRRSSPRPQAPSRCSRARRPSPPP